MADRSLKLLSKNRLERLEYRWLCSFVMSQFLDEALSAGVFEIASRQHRRERNREAGITMRAFRPRFTLAR
jgi:hypothetical protein